MKYHLIGPPVAGRGLLPCALIFSDTSTVTRSSKPHFPLARTSAVTSYHACHLRLLAAQKHYYLHCAQICL
jgi:hypothetical protein